MKLPEITPRIRSSRNDGDNIGVLIAKSFALIERFALNSF